MAKRYLECIDGHDPAKQRHLIQSRTFHPFLVVAAVSYLTVCVLNMSNVELSLAVPGLYVPPLQSPRGPSYPQRAHQIADLESRLCSDLDGGRRKSRKQFQHHVLGLLFLMIMNLGTIPNYRNLTTPRRMRKTDMGGLALSPACEHGGDSCVCDNIATYSYEPGSRGVHFLTILLRCSNSWTV